MQLDEFVRNAMADAMETAIGASSRPQIRTGAAPTDSGGVLTNLMREA